MRKVKGTLKIYFSFFETFYFFYFFIASGANIYSGNPRGSKILKPSGCLWNPLGGLGERVPGVHTVHNASLTIFQLSKVFFDWGRGGSRGGGQKKSGPFSPGGRNPEESKSRAYPEGSREVRSQIFRVGG